MNNQQLQMFSMNPVDIENVQRSRMHRPKPHLTTFDAGKVVPLYAEEVLPGDTVTMDVSSLVRMTTPKFPTMDNAYLDIHFFFVPRRLVWEHWKEFMGENTAGPWRQQVSYTIPQINAPTSGGDGVYQSSVPGFACGTLADYLGFPTKVGGISFDACYIRGYCLIWNNYYRDENIMSPCDIPLGDSALYGNNSGVEASSNVPDPYAWYISNNNYVTRAKFGCAPLPCCKFHDMFTSCLPEPRKGPILTLPLGTVAPIVAANSTDTLSGSMAIYDASGTATGQYVGYSSGSFVGVASSVNGAQLSLSADLSKATASTIDEIRNVFMLAHYYEALARGGSRYFESIYALFGVKVPDNTVQIPEFLGGVRIPINITQVAQTSATDAAVISGGTSTPLGNLAAYSQTGDRSSIFTKSFCEHGILFGMVCVRTENSYQQGIPRQLSRKTLFDFYFRQFANASEQPVYNKEIYAQGSSVVDANGVPVDDGVFGYQEAWYEYRYSPKIVSGEFRSNYAQSLDVWHYADNYSAKPALSADWIREPQSNIQRTLAVSGVSQFLGDFVFDAIWVREMPLYSVPGLDRL